MKQLSDAQINANRINAQKSTGPRTDEGKAISSRNARKLGIYTHTDILDGEGEPEFLQLREDYFAQLQPAPGLQEQLVLNMIILEWHIRRYRIAENSILQMAVNDPDLGGPGYDGTGCFRLATAIEEVAGRRQSQQITRVLTRLTRELAATLKQYMTIRKNFPPPVQSTRPSQQTDEPVKNEPKEFESTIQPNSPRSSGPNWKPLKLKVLFAGSAPPDFN